MDRLSGSELGSTPKSSTRLLEGQVIDDTNLFSQNSKSGRTTTTTIAPPRRPRRPDPLRTPTAESPRPAAPRTRVIELQATSAPPRRPSQVQITWRLQRSRPEADSRPARIGRSVAGPAATSASR